MSFVLQKRVSSCKAGKSTQSMDIDEKWGKTKINSFPFLIFLQQFLSLYFVIFFSNNSRIFNNGNFQFEMKMRNEKIVDFKISLYVFLIGFKSFFPEGAPTYILAIFVTFRKKGPRSKC